MTIPGTDRSHDLVERARALDKLAVASLVDRFEDTRPEAVARRADALSELRARGRERSVIIGMTGTPGSGKSSLLARLVPTLLAEHPTVTVAVVGIDPSSTVSRGALLGDRTRMHFPPHEPRVYVRSQATATVLGGLAPATFQVCLLLSWLFDAVFVETAGIGQSELDIRLLADHVLLVLQPLGGDELQFLKAGIIEIPDSFVLNKCDDPSAARSHRQLLASLSLARPFDAEPPKVFRTSALNGAGIEELARSILDIVGTGPTRPPGEVEGHALTRWVQDEWGRAGYRHLLQRLGGAAALVQASGGYEAAQAAFSADFTRALGGRGQP